MGAASKPPAWARRNFAQLSLERQSRLLLRRRLGHTWAGREINKRDAIGPRPFGWRRRRRHSIKLSREWRQSFSCSCSCCCCCCYLRYCLHLRGQIKRRTRARRAAKQRRSFSALFARPAQRPLIASAFTLASAAAPQWRRHQLQAPAGRATTAKLAVVVLVSLARRTQASPRALTSISADAARKLNWTGGKRAAHWSARPILAPTNALFQPSALSSQLACSFSCTSRRIVAGGPSAPSRVQRGRAGDLCVRRRRRSATAARHFQFELAKRISLARPPGKFSSLYFLISARQIARPLRSLLALLAELLRGRSRARWNVAAARAPASGQIAARPAAR